jgi:hypothetical protein
VKPLVFTDVNFHYIPILPSHNNTNEKLLSNSTEIVVVPNEGLTDYNTYKIPGFRVKPGLYEVSWRIRLAIQRVAGPMIQRYYVAPCAFNIIDAGGSSWDALDYPVTQGLGFSTESGYIDQHFGNVDIIRVSDTISPGNYQNVPIITLAVRQEVDSGGHAARISVNYWNMTIRKIGV